ncbi:hypothetical protein AAG570_010856, partial [Ranatra chinensis]
TVYYCPDFILPSEEQYIIDKVYSAPKPKWTQLLNRRLQNWGGIPHPSGMIAEKLPEWLMKYVSKVDQLKIVDGGRICPNHVLVNEYLPGQGIMPHTDGPLFYPTIATITCGSHAVLEFRPNREEHVDKRGENKYSILLERRSLIVVKDDLYKQHLHSISEISEDILDNSVVNLNRTQYKIGDTLKRETRISLTIRHVPKTSKLHLKLCR